MTEDQIIDEYIRQIARDGYDTQRISSNGACARKEMRGFVEAAGVLLKSHGLSMPDTYEDCRRVVAPMALAVEEPQGYWLFQHIIKLELTRTGRKVVFDESDLDAAMDDYVKAANQFFASRGLSMPDGHMDCMKGILDILESEGYRPALDEILRRLKVELRGREAGVLH